MANPDRLVQLIAELLAIDIRVYPNGPPAEPSATSGPRYSRTMPDRKISGQLHDGCALDRVTHARVQ